MKLTFNLLLLADSSALVLNNLKLSEPAAIYVR
uniref:Uncharacterized protein n=1 Tax=Moniliophthora roreri TaxID=221103 RepID=A0A0W0FX96_MONRR